MYNRVIDKRSRQERPCIGYNSTLMRLFRRTLDLSPARLRLANATDLNHVARLFRDAARRYYGLAGSDLPALLTAAHAVVMESDEELWGVMLVGRRAETTIWLRGVALVDGLEVTPALEKLWTFLRTELAARNVRHVFYAADEVTDVWLHPRLRILGYTPTTEVIVYEKRTLEVPTSGNQSVHVRAALPVDLEAIMQLDQVCFEPQWTKDDTVMRTAIAQGPLCIVAELEQETVGYAYATSHFSHQLTHLVRIAVDPAYQGLGIGVRLLAEVIAFARRHNATLVTLNTQSYNVQAQRLYRWFGFAANGERQIILRYDL